MALHLVKLCVGAESLEDLKRWMARRARTKAGPVHRTRAMPKRREEILDGGSLYWVIRGRIEARQAVVGLEEGPLEDGRPGCHIRLDAAVVRTVPRAMRPFQGWRYLEAQAAPADLPELEGGAALPPALAAELRDLGLL
ncbi:MAG: DUF1489 domain-containing protein [Alphaproteobacteria bacterium]|nr:DUF1489 domain-containing protein [Alphaproteobacteria bacterium]